jgi:hypothetical protein
MEIEGEFFKPWTVYRLDLDGGRIELVTEADTREELKYKCRADWRYGTFHNRKRVD